MSNEEVQIETRIEVTKSIFLTPQVIRGLVLQYAAKKLGCAKSEVQLDDEYFIGNGFTAYNQTTEYIDGEPQS